MDIIKEVKNNINQATVLEEICRFYSGLMRILKIRHLVRLLHERANGMQINANPTPMDFEI